MKRLRSSSSSDNSDNESPSTSCSSNKYGSKPGTPASMPKKPAEVFRKDLISAMKLPDSHHVSPEDYYLLGDTWRQEWEKGVQVPAFPETIPHASIRNIAEKPKEVLFTLQRRYIQCWSQDATETGYVNIKELAEAMCPYDLDDMDLYWLQALNAELGHMGEGPVDELTMERTMEALERHCHDNMNHAIDTVEGLGIEYDEDVICDVCRSPDSEEGNDMVFCDKCNICVHQACYGIVKVPEGNWLCRTCVLGIDPQCQLCPIKGGAMKATRAGTKWAHVSCALWIPEVSIACPERMEPITKVSHIPPSRWSLICSLCKLKTGACIQCSVKNCTIPFHVTCAFEHSLEMKTILDEGDEVKFKSYCLKHSKPKNQTSSDPPAPGLSPCQPAHSKQPKAGEPGSVLSPARPKPPIDPERGGLRAQRLLELEEGFYTLIHPEELALNLGLPRTLLDFIYQYWKLKRKSNFNRALLPPSEEENLLLLPHEDSIHTRMRMFMHLRQDLERVRNLCYMVSRREKLKLSQSKAQEQIFNLHVKLLNQEVSAGLPVLFPVESMLFRPPPRITLKLKMPKVSLGNGKTGSKSGNGPLCPDNSGNVHQHSGGGGGLGEGGGKGKGGGKPPLHGRGRREERSNGSLLSTSGQSRREGSTATGPALTNSTARGSALPTGKPLTGKTLTGKPLALHGHSSNGNVKLDPERAGHVPKSNGVMEKMVGVAQKDSACQTPSEQEAIEGSGVKASQSASFRRSTMEHFNQSFKEATVSLVRTTEDLRGDKLSQGGKGSRSAKDRPWAKPASGGSQGPSGTRPPPYQETDGYCPDLELSDSEPEAKGQRWKQGRGGQAGGDYSRGNSRGKQGLGRSSRTSEQR
ncbi:protein Jade-3-like [Coregonus clupeaformis]|uniref:protein Jade-3-like n=1 Tax=Coregonus clupeaformis TaxID=59861 RepID=UPI001E1C9522|nr:protein Jade-3-like [Coregonus clupeaformis]XP_041696678.2 protein Jade-3-like [Coregonus clupeaformis]XP_041696679.2 protein Jade-3-like [Coregonus clupeaformis]XP_041696681.2 protein Jade-3-like [Coregonus clupeaformis]